MMSHFLRPNAMWALRVCLALTCLALGLTTLPEGVSAGTQPTTSNTATNSVTAARDPVAVHEPVALPHETDEDPLKLLVEPPAPPVGLTAEQGRVAGEVKLSWNAPAPDDDDDDDHHDYRYHTGGRYSAWTTIPASASSSNHVGYVNGLTGGVVHTFQVRAINTNGDPSLPSATATATPRGVAPRTRVVRGVNDPAQVVVTLELSPSAIGEGGEVSTVTASLDSALATALTVTVSAVAVAPAAPGDFTLSANRTLAIAAGELTSSGSVTISADDNTVDAPHKEVTVSGTVAGATDVTGPSDVTLTITDDDEPAPTICTGGSAGDNLCSNIDLMSYLPLKDIGGSAGNDIWGWQDSLTGKEYAIMGRKTGTAFVDISDPLNPIYLGNLPPHSGNSEWRDMKVYRDHAFIVSEASHSGMQVFDLTQLRTVPSPPVTFSETAYYSGFSDAHNLAINEDSGFAYAVGTNTCDGGLHMINIQNPTNPTSAGCFSEGGYSHDAQCVNYIGPDPDHQGAEICFNSNTDTLTIVDMTNKAAPEMLSSAGYTGSGYTHQGWLTEDHTYFLLGDEYDEYNRPSFGTTTYLWDISDLESPTLIGTHTSTTKATDHNQYVKGKYTYQSNYQAGLRVLDVTDIANGNLTEVAFFDMVPDSDSPLLYEGAWGNYPFFDSGMVIVSVTRQGLFVLRPNLVDRIQPKVGRAMVDGETLTLTYGEALDETSTPAIDAFTVTVEGAARSVSGISVSGSAVVLTLAPAVTVAQEVRVTYTAPQTTPIRDEAENNAPGLSSREVRNDTRDVTVSTTALPVNEGSTGTYTVVLNSQPTASVTVTPSRTGSSDVTFSPPTLTFTTSTWNTAQQVTVTAAQDSDAVDDSATISHAVTGGDYAAVTADSVVVTVDDDETADTTAPRVASITRQNPTSSPTNADSLTWRVTFSEAVSNVNAADFVVSGTTATVTAVAAVSGVTGAYDVTASGGNLVGVSATVTLTISSSHNIADGAGNELTNTAPTGTNNNSYVVDNTAPSVTISGVPAASNAPFTATFTFSEAVTGFAVGDITLTNATVSNFTATSTTVYTALVTPTASGMVTVNVPANAAQDAAGNGNTAASVATTIYTPPAITIVAGASPVTEGTSAVFTLSRAGSTTAALTVNVTVSETGGDMVAASNEGDRTVTFLANSATVTLSIATASDSVDEANSVVTATISADTGSPASYSVGTPASAMVTVEDNDTRDVTVSTTALPVNEGSTGTYTVVLNSQPTASVTVTPSRTGSSDVTFSPPTLTFTTSTWNTAQQVTVTAAQDSDAVDDSATISHAVTGGDYAAVTADSVVVTVDDDETADTTAPRVASITRQNPTSSPTNADSLTWRVTFSEAVSNVNAADFVVSGTTATVTAVAAVSGVTGAYDVTASGGNLVGVSATVTLTISSSHNIADGAGNELTNTAPTGTNNNSYVVDNTAPSVTISGVPAASNAPFTATFTFSEAVTGFAVGDITLTNATVSNFTATSTTVYTALVTPTASGMVTVNVPANAAQDAAGNGNTAASVATTIYTPPAITIVAGASPVTEGTSAVFTLSRAGSTTAALTVNVTVSETGGDMVAASNEGDRTVTFLANSATVTLSIATASDSVDEANSVVTATISADTGSPASYSVGTPASAMVTVEDNDTRDVTVSTTALPVNEGSTGTYTVVLNSQPTASVTVTPSRTGSSDVTFSPPTLTFTALNWNTAQQVTVTAAQDSDAVDDSATISHAVTGGDYAAVTADSVVVTVDDDETADTTAPRVASIVRQNPTSSPTNADSLTWRVTFSETVSNVNAADFAVSGTTATVTAVAAVSGVTGAYDVTASGGNLASVSATVTLAIAASHNIEDGASNALSNTAPTGTNDNSYVVDNTAPTVTISDVPATSDAPFTATFTFSEAVTGFAVGDITLSNATASSFTVTSTVTVSGSTVTRTKVSTALVTPAAAGAVTVDVSANAAQDAAGNGNTAATRASSTYAVPAITITAGTSPVTEGTSAVFTLSRAGSTTAALTVNVTVSETGGDMVAASNEGDRTVTFLANSATVTLSIATASDSVDEANSVVTATISADTGSPVSYSVGTPASAMVTVEDNDTRDVTVSTTALPVNEGSTGTYTVVLNSQPTASVTVTPSRTGSSDVTFSPPTLTFTALNWNTAQQVTVTAAQDSDAVDDSATISHAVTGGDYAAVTVDSVVVTVDDDETADTTAPRVASIARQNPTSSPTNADSLTWRVTFSETVSNVNAADFAVSGTTATVTAVAAVSGVTGGYDVTASGGNLAGVSATVTLTISSSHNIADGASNALSNTAPTGTNDNSYVVDNTAPSVTISGVPSASDAPFTATFTFSEAVTGFTAGDITLTNASASSFTVTSTVVFTALITPAVSGTVTVDVPANAAQDAAGNGNTAAARATSTYTGTAALPAITIAAGASPVTEGTSAVFTLSRTGSTTDALTVNVTVSEAGGDMVAASNEGARTVTFLANSTTVTLSIATASDSVAEANSVVTATISADTGSPASYSVGAPGSAMVTVRDNDSNITVPGAPTALSASAAGGTQINLSWTAPTDDGGSPIIGYKIEVSPDGAADWTELVANTGNANTTYEHMGLTAGTTRHYRVSAINSDGAGDPSNIDDATTRPITGPITGGGGGGGGGGGPTPSEVDFEWNVKRDIEALDGGNDWPTGLWSDGETLWIAENGQGADDEVYAYDLASGERLSEREFTLAEANRAPRGFWSDGVTVWVSDSGRERLFAYRLADGERLAEREFALAEGNADARGIWSDHETMWVLDGRADRLFAYALTSGELLGEYALDSANGDPHGIWSDGVTVWVSDHGAKRLFAYRLEGEELTRNRDEEFGELSQASNNSPRGIWSDGDFMYVADESDDRVYTYNMPDGIDARLASLTLSGVDIGEFDPARTDYEGSVADGVTETTVEAEAMQRRTDVAIDPPDADGDDANGYQVDLSSVSEVTITVTSADGSRTRVYRVALEAPPVELALTPAWTAIDWPGAGGVATAEAGLPDAVVAVYRWDEATAAWLAFFPGLEDVPGLNTLTTLSAGATYWVAVGEPVTWSVVKRGAALAAADRGP